MINLTHKPSPVHKLVFGEQDIGRLDLPYDATFKSLASVDEGNVWYLNVVNCANDRWSEFTPSALTKFQLTVAYQTVLDSLVPDVFKALNEVVTDPYLKYLYSRISTMEHTHALSYSSGITQAVGAKATEFIDVIYSDPMISLRIEDELAIIKQFIKATETWSNTEANRKLLLQTLVAVFALEGIKFPFSFFTTWTLNKGYNNCIQGFSALLLSIAVDELTVHTATGSNFINKLRKDPNFKEEFSSGWFDTMATEYLHKVATKEISWASYLLETGPEPGFTDQICEHFIKYWTNRRAKEIRLPELYAGIVKNDIEVWFDDYRNVKNKGSALQEISNINYQLGMVVNDLDKFDLKEHT